jgi:hypothetical protein
MPVRYGIFLSELRLADALLARTYKFQIPAQTEHQHAHFRSSALMATPAETPRSVPFLHEMAGTA